MLNQHEPNGRRIILAPDALNALAAGFDLVAALLAATLGPRQGSVLNARSGRSVEILSDAGTIARRIVAIPGRGQNSGAMLARRLAWQMHEEYGDGAATALVLARAMLRAAMPLIAAGVDPVTIRRGLETALPVALATLAQAATPVEGLATLTAFATGSTGDAELGAVLGEIVDLLGPDAALSIEEYPVPYLDREYVEGAAWRAHPAARDLVAEGSGEVVLPRPLILLADEPLTTFADVRPALEQAGDPADCRPLLVVAAKVAGEALAALTVNNARATLTAVAALLSVSGPGLGDELEDIATLTGGRVLGTLRGRLPRRLSPGDLGAARRAVLTRESLTIVGGAGDAAAVAARADLLRRMAARQPATSEEWARLHGRLARLGGGSAIVKLGAPSGTALRERRERAEKAFRALLGLRAEGVVPGGGSAYLACQPALRAFRECCPAGTAAGLDVLQAALEAPFSQIVRNHGRIHPPLAMAEARRRGGDSGFDAISGEVVDVRAAGILDSLRVTQGALRLATSTAISLLTTSAVVLPKAAKRAQRVRP